MKEEGIQVPMTKLCAWFEVPRRTMYYRTVKSAPKVQERFEKPIKEMIEQDPSFGYRTVAALLNFNKNTVQRIFQIRGWQVKRRPIGFRPRVQAMPSVAQHPNERWSTDLCRVWAGRDGWASLAIVIDCCTREILGWHLSRSAKATTAESALEQALINRFGTLGKVPTSFLLRSDNELNAIGVAQKEQAHPRLSKQPKKYSATSNPQSVVTSTCYLGQRFTIMNTRSCSDGLRSSPNLKQSVAQWKVRTLSTGSYWPQRPYREGSIHWAKLQSNSGKGLMI